MNAGLQRRCGGALLALAAGLSPAWAADPGLSQPQATYEQERARCLRGQTQQDRATCLKEAGASRDEARRGGLAAPPGTDLLRNATQRCEAQPPADREACVQRIHGAGSTSGSVEGGGQIRQTETPVR
ncbi:hypothetical protein [Ramlibacter pallidus]|uniref:Secreted protein n=1 Tax=Ramlibacter pallidus TaxID=2780087 RepID=A0ABR9S3Q9_9BURK|nr:hypothetical protein [Ramlibacter pallidus]